LGGKERPRVPGNSICFLVTLKPLGRKGLEGCEAATALAGAGAIAESRKARFFVWGLRSNPQTKNAHINSETCQDSISQERLSLEDVFAAYYECRRHKRKRSGALRVEVHLEKNLVDLWREINSGTWTPGASTVFIVDKPVTREIFAAAFRDRIVHHLVTGRLNPLFEKYFIYDSYSCRTGRGTHNFSISGNYSYFSVRNTGLSKPLSFVIVLTLQALIVGCGLKPA
jgi:hypothetical protein